MNQAEQNTPTAIQVVPARFVTVHLASAVTGLTPAAIHNRIARGQWIEGRHFVKREGRTLIDLKGYEKWAAQGV